MKVIFRTNIDNYSNKDCFPDGFGIPPRVGDLVEVKKSFISYFRDQKLPIRLEVKRVTWTEHGSSSEPCAICELWYNETDKKAADMAGAQTL